jgi:hypothetical protein
MPEHNALPKLVEGYIVAQTYAFICSSEFLFNDVFWGFVLCSTNSNRRFRERTVSIFTEEGGMTFSVSSIPNSATRLKVPEGIFD